ncbi:hypothetical protein PLICRDRAFT_670352 [Plicaturopsis crispa FD-325 SS-3]|uniref:Xylanolytic transcriptional activator regulatory domain-containing protein n=1 Tax=Plicaturopsis crispa FD-325 SS-3 TaxID=944288 RepID=A0A0C9SR96_PLICR|nr:hypothetical protein PLICRDRAFT_670352 [Plicaturopsis crispa FD-325 SS-3]
MRDNRFGFTVLLVCALGARYSSDPKVRLTHETDTNSAGWQWFNQVHSYKSIYASPTAYELQTICMSAMFLQASSAPQVAWTLIGSGVRLAVSSGAHMRKSNYGRTTMKDELLKRAFWVLVCLDRSASADLGRLCAIQDEDFDLDLLENCDDAYWENFEHPEQISKQPPEKPSEIAFFICLVELNQMIVSALRNIYSANKSKITPASNSETLVAELDSALNKWIDDIPDHYPSCEDPIFFNQSATLHCS